MIKPFGTRVLVRINKRYLKDKKGKQILNEDNMPVFDQDQEAKILVSNISELKKGQIIYPVIRGGVPIYKNETSKYLDVIIDEEDIYRYESK
jgi:hypothetical protein